MYKVIKYLSVTVFIFTLIIDYFFNTKFDYILYASVILGYLLIFCFLGFVITEIVHITGRFKNLKYHHMIWTFLISTTIIYSYEIIPKSINKYLKVIDLTASERLRIEEITGEYYYKNNRLILHNNKIHIITDSTIINGFFEPRLDKKNVIDIHISKQPDILYPSYFSMFYLKLNNGQTRLRFTHRGTIDNYVSLLVRHDWILKKNIPTRSLQTDLVDPELHKKELNKAYGLNLDSLIKVLEIK
jgi:hypothetical protein